MEKKEIKYYENFFVDDVFYSEIDEYLCSFEDEDMLIADLPDTFTERLCLTDLEPVVHLDANFIVEHIDEERFDEHDIILDNLICTLNKYINFEELNDKMPKAHYKNDKYVVINKEYLLNFVQIK